MSKTTCYLTLESVELGGQLLVLGPEFLYDTILLPTQLAHGLVEPSLMYTGQTQL